MGDSTSFVQGAALPYVYLRALMALVDKANLQRDRQSGQAGLPHLTENYGIQPDHIFNSRDPSFLPVVLRVTNQRGFKVVRNSLSGDLLTATRRCLAESGAMVERAANKTFSGAPSCPWKLFETNRTFIGLKLRLISHVYLQKCLGIDQVPDSLVVAAPKPTPVFRSDRTYLLMGGLGGLGRALAGPTASWKTYVLKDPEVQETGHLHEALPSSDLDLFILFLSYGSIAGQWGQANYVAVNTFLDAFVQYRHHNGLVASVIDVGAMDDVGFVSQNQGVLERPDRIGIGRRREDAGHREGAGRRPCQLPHQRRGLHRAEPAV
ncbi:polyketide synthase [Seiridium cupressi]